MIVNITKKNTGRVNVIRWIKQLILRYKVNKKLKEIRKRDPFIYD